MAEIACSAGMGGGSDDYAGIEIEVWPENEDAATLFRAMQTQWNYDQGFRTGLNYAALTAVESRIGIKKKRRGKVFAQLQTIEIEFLNAVAQYRRSALEN